jgi:hypothetical protein
MNLSGESGLPLIRPWQTFNSLRVQLLKNSLSTVKMPKETMNQDSISYHVENILVAICLQVSKQPGYLNRPLLLMSDNHGSDNGQYLTAMSRPANICIFWLPPHLLKVLDLWVFWSLKKN